MLVIRVKDHAVGVDAFDASRIEIIRGPAALLYGSDITGGVVNVLDGRIPSERPVNRIEGMIMGTGRTGSKRARGRREIDGCLRESGVASTWSDARNRKCLHTDV